MAATTSSSYKGRCPLSFSELEQHFRKHDLLEILPPDASLTVKVSQVICEAFQAISQSGLSAADRRTFCKDVVREVCDSFMLAAGRSLAEMPGCTLTLNKDEQSVTLTPYHTDRLLFRSAARSLVTDTAEIWKKIDDQQQYMLLTPAQRIFLRDVPFSDVGNVTIRRIEFPVHDSERLVITAVGDGELQAYEAAGIFKASMPVKVEGGVRFCKVKSCVSIHSQSGLVLTTSSLDLAGKAVSPKTTEKDDS